MRTAIIICLSVILFHSSCGTPKTSVNDMPLIPAEFEFSPPTYFSNDTDKLRFIILNPRFEYSFRFRQKPMFEKFLKSIKDDFLEMIIARGFQYRGPFDSRDGIVFSDKKFAELMLEPTIEFDFDGLTATRKSRYNVFTSSYESYYVIDCMTTLTGKINLEITEPFTSTKLWKKSVSIPARTFAVKTTRSYSSIDHINFSEPGIWNPIVENLKDIYKASLTTTWNHLDPEELKLVREQSKEIRKNSGYNRR